MWFQKPYFLRNDCDIKTRETKTNEFPSSRRTTSPRQLHRIDTVSNTLDSSSFIASMTGNSSHILSQSKPSASSPRKSNFNDISPQNAPSSFDHIIDIKGKKRYLFTMHNFDRKPRDIVFTPASQCFLPLSPKISNNENNLNKKGEEEEIEEKEKDHEGKEASSISESRNFPFTPETFQPEINEFDQTKSSKCLDDKHYEFLFDTFNDEKPLRWNDRKSFLRLEAYNNKDVVPPMQIRSTNSSTLRASRNVRPQVSNGLEMDGKFRSRIRSKH
jgi:hypothetical protein